MPTNFEKLIDQGPYFDPRFLNLEYWFNKILELSQAIISIELPFGADILAFLKVLLTLIVIFLIGFVFYLIIRIRELKAMPEIFLTKVPVETRIEKIENPRWQKILEHILSHNSSDWRLAILEADNLLDDLSRQMAWVGENLGERLKNADPNSFKTLDYAWEAHRVRNQIAHEGLQYILNHYEAKRVITLFEKVFREFDFI